MLILQELNTLTFQKLLSLITYHDFLSVVFSYRVRDNLISFGIIKSKKILIYKVFLMSLYSSILFDLQRHNDI